MGIAWGDIAGLLGVVGSAAEGFAEAARSGLVALAMDGLDEVAGRFDPNVVQGVVGVVANELQTDMSNVVLSGRTTEAALVAEQRAFVVGIDLPNPDEPAFSDYATSVVRLVTPQWPKLAARIPEPPVNKEALRDEPPEEWHVTNITEWIRRVFGDLGKDRSLFFVQSLACIGRSKQLDGNRPLVITTGNSVRIAEASLYDVCILAAALACVREQDKIEDIARQYFGPTEQLELLTWLAVRASAGVEDQLNLLTPQELARRVLALDPTHQFEEFTAVLRQMQKHALLFATGEGVRVGDWRPQFLSDWVRCALLCRAWGRVQLAPGSNASDIEKAVATAERSRLAFQYLFAWLAQRDELARPDVLVNTLCDFADADSPEAAANFWSLIAGLGPEGCVKIARFPASIPPMADLSEIALDGLALGREFGGTLFVSPGADVSGCTLSGCEFQSCDFTGATFTGSRLAGVSFKYCDGPILFENCTFEATRFEDMRAKALPALQFIGCTFDDETRIVQGAEVRSGVGYGPVASFEDCEGSSELADMLSGSMIGLDPRRTLGYSVLGAGPSRQPAVECLMAILKPFFPRRAGSDAQLQARPYIRSSAIGRGRLPTGAPTASALIDILFSEGFTDGGREAHVYAPWSPVAGAKDGSVELRTELLAFVREGRQGKTVKRLLGRIGRAASW